MSARSVISGFGEAYDRVYARVRVSGKCWSREWSNVESRLSTRSAKPLPPPRLPSIAQ